MVTGSCKQVCPVETGDIIAQEEMLTSGGGSCLNG